MKIDFSDIPEKKRAWIVDNPGLPRPDWWDKVGYTLKLIYYNDGPEGVAKVNIKDYLLDEN